MPINLVDYETKTKEAVKAFWKNREKAKEKQEAAGVADKGERAGVTTGNNLDGFVGLIASLVKANGLPDVSIFRRKGLLTLPGYFRPTKLWDVLVLHQNRLVAAIELKSQVGPSFGNNFNNRTEEAIGSGHDFWTAYREGAFGRHPRPFLGWMILVEDCPESRKPVSNISPHFPLFPEFTEASYLGRYDILCQRLVQEQLYTTASVIASSREAISHGRYSDLSEMTSLKTFVTSFAGHIASEAARRK